jgi:hypothetical protein
MSRTNCRKVRREIEEGRAGEPLTTPVREHLSNCAACEAFGNEQQRLTDIVASLGTIEAPADFDFKLRARLAASRSSRSEVSSGNRFSIRSVAFATLILLFAFVAILMNSRSRSNESAPVAQSNGAASRTSNQTAQPSGNAAREVASNAGVEMGAALPLNGANAADVQEHSAVRNLARRSGNSVSRYAIARNGGVKATDLSARPALVLRPTEIAMGSSVFQLGASYQSLKVSVDDGRGSSRTISLPTVSFGSSRVLAQNPTPIMASMRDSW